MQLKRLYVLYWFLTLKFCGLCGGYNCNALKAINKKNKWNYSVQMSCKLNNEVQFPMWVFVPSMLDCITARPFWSLTQSSTERTKDTNLPDWFAEYIRRLYSCLTSCGGIEGICSTINFMWSRIWEKSYV